VTMTEQDVVSPSRIERVLELACAYNVPLSLVTESGGTVYRYKSRMLDMKKPPSVSSLVIDYPVTDGPAIALKPRIEITLYLALDQERFAFESKVLRKTTFTLESRRSISALEIAYPHVLRSDQRRAYYRVPVPVGKPIAVKCAVVDDAGESFTPEPGAWNFPPDKQFQGTIMNLSVGGMLVALTEAVRSLVDVETRIGVRLLLAHDETPLVLKGIVRRIETGHAPDEFRVGVEFIDTEEAFECKLAINRLYRYVAERQREIIKSGGG
jgi:c-di-GMP-binding flagellar brake protein YcgR